MLATVLTMALSQNAEPASPAMREFRAAWVATVANIDWPSKPGLSNDQMRAEMVTILDSCEKANLNAVIFQVRPHADAMYDSPYEPWSYYLTGEQGKAPADGWDPLEFLVEQAHDRGLEVHCWFNPYRAKHPAQRGPLSSRSVPRSHPKLVKQYGDYMWMDPGEKAVQDWSFKVFMDVVERYDIDGVHIDDYFYPYPEYGKGADFPDGPSWKKYQDGGGDLNRGDWRRQNVNDFVQRVYKGIKARKPWVKFGVSPFGIYRPGEPGGVKSTFDQYEKLYADCLLWFQKGWMDYFSPQLYWKLDGDQSYRLLLDYWKSKDTMGRHLWPGNFSGKLSAGEGDWPTTELVNQIEYTRKLGVTGNVFYSAKTFTQDFKGIDGVLRNGVYKEKAIVPSCPWLSDKSPAPPECALDDSTSLLSLGGAGKGARFYAVYADTGSGLRLLRMTSASRTTLSDPALSKATTVAVSVIDHFSNESKLQIVKGQ